MSSVTRQVVCLQDLDFLARRGPLTCVNAADQAPGCLQAAEVRPWARAHRAVSLLGIIEARDLLAMIGGNRAHFALRLARRSCSRVRLSRWID